MTQNNKKDKHIFKVGNLVKYRGIQLRKRRGQVALVVSAPSGNIKNLDDLIYEIYFLVDPMIHRITGRFMEHLQKKANHHDPK